jgi:hypothetical protein
MRKPTSTREQADLQHLSRVRELTAEVAAAISAIEHNNLLQLQVAIANQERICSQLATMKWTPLPLGKKPAGEVESATSETSGQIHAAYAALAQLNRVYAGVVKRSKRAIGLLSALYGTQRDGYGPKLSRTESSQTLSCEV